MILDSITDFKKGFPLQEDTSEQIRFLLKVATRAPSTHNCQPWQFRIEDNRIGILTTKRVIV